jgi:hypothetical protein
MEDQSPIANYFVQQRPQWRRNRSFQGQQSTSSNIQTNPLYEKPPIPVSTATKNKLSVFQFGGQCTGDGTTKQPVISLLSNDKKENQVTRAECSTAAAAATEPTGAPVGAEKLPKSALDILSGYVPSTPAGKLALPDLIGMGDVRRTIQDVSPEDRIEWDQHSSNLSIAINTKKRARSSSPTSSPAAKTPIRFNDKGEPLHPQIDPGLELWGRYSLNGSTPRGSAIPLLAQLMHTSSPQVSKERTAPRAMPVFRRANSCGNQFPKRRRLGGPDEDVFTESVNLGSSKLSVLIDRVHEGLAQPKQSHVEVEHSDTPSASEELLSGHHQNYTPLQHRVAKEHIGAQYTPCEPPSQVKNSENHLNLLRSDVSDYGEFDEDDLDDSTLLKVITHQHGLACPVDQASIRVESLPKTSAKDSECPSFTDKKIYENEYDDSDEDLFAADLEDMVSKFDNQRPPDVNETSVNQCQNGATALGTNPEDEFGDNGFEDLDFEIAEAAATQSKAHNTSSLLPVRTRFL